MIKEMDMPFLYFTTLGIACVITAASLLMWRRLFGPYFLDTPEGLKHHATAIPVLGGLAVFTGLAASLIFVRLTTNFPTGTLHSLRGILYGATLIFILGLVDDFKKPKGLGITVKLLGQIIATLCLVNYGVHITLFGWPLFSYLLTFLWVVGITNAFNLLDIADGLCISQALVAALGLWLIALPSEHLYVNFCACALAGACIGFWPYNHVSRLKTFLGDSGSTLLGFVLAALSMGTDYSTRSNLGFLAPLLILAIPLLDTGFVSLIRILHGKNPLRGSPDHAALRLKEKGWSPRKILLSFLIAACALNILAFTVTHVSEIIALVIYMLVLILAVLLTICLARLPAPQA